MGFLSEMHASLPGIDSIRQNVEAAITWGPWEYNRAFVIGAIIDGSARDAGNSPTTLLRPGLMMGQVRSSESTDPLKFKEWDPDASEGDGTEDFAGVLLFDAHMQMFSTDKDRWFGYILVGGNLKSSSIIFPGESSAGLADLSSNEYYAKSVLASRFLLDDYPHQMAGSPILGGWRNIVHKTSDYTVKAADNGVLFTTLGAEAAVAFTLPAVANSKGMRFGFYNAVDQDMSVESASTGDLITYNDESADKVAVDQASEKVGVMFEAIGLDGNKWAVIHYLANAAQTITVTST